MAKVKRRRSAPDSPISIIDACNDPKLFGSLFKDQATWSRWFVFIKAAFGLPLSMEEYELFQKCTNRALVPQKRVSECWLIVGRRGGKSFLVALIATYLATFIDWLPFLSPGERGTVVIIASERKQARVIFRYIKAFLSLPLLAPLVERETMESFDLRGQITIEVQTASYRSVRGYTVVAALLDEIAFWRSEESNNPDFEILEALRPATATVPGAMILAVSSPYARKGVLYDTFRNYYGKESPDILVWKAPTWDMNPTVPQRIFDLAYERDSAKADAEYGANFRRDVQAFLAIEVVEACTDTGVFERPFKSGHKYCAFVDPSGGSQDSFTMAIAHAENDKRVLDLIREVPPPFSPEAVVKDFCQVLRQYGIGVVTGDRYGGVWPAERFLQYDVIYEPSKLTKNDIYRDFLPLANSKNLLLLDDKHLKLQLTSLERRTARGGKDTIDHPPGGHDDRANAAAGSLVLCETFSPVDLW